MKPKIIFLNTIKICLIIFLAIFWVLISNILPIIKGQEDNLLLLLYSEGISICLMLLVYRNQKEIFAFPLKSFRKQYFSGFVLGTVFFIMIWGICILLGAFKVNFVFNWRKSLSIILFLGGFIIQGMCEELVCRGFIQGKIKQLNLPR